MRGAAIPPRLAWSGATATHVWLMTDDAAPVPELTPFLVEQLMEIIELQAGQAPEPYDHWSYAWRVATGQESAVAGLDFNETPEQSRLRQSVARLGVFLRGIGLGRAPAARVPTSHHHERHLTWSMPISQPQQCPGP